MSDRILRDVAHTLEVEFHQDGALADPGVVTIDITRADGALLVNDGSTTGTGSAARKYLLAAQADLDRLRAVWSGTLGGQPVKLTTHHEVVGAHLFSESEARAYGKTTPLSDPTRYPDSTIAGARDRIASFFEETCGVSFVPRYDRWRVAGNGQRWLYLRKARAHKIVSASVGGVAVAASDLVPDPDLSKLYRTDGVWTLPSASDPLNVVVSYEHGFEAPPSDIREAALDYLVAQVVDSGVPDRASSLITDAGTVRYFQPGEEFPTGIPNVDEVLLRYQADYMASVAP